MPGFMAKALLTEATVGRQRLWQRLWQRLPVVPGLGPDGICRITGLVLQPKSTAQLLLPLLKKAQSSFLLSQISLRGLKKKNEALKSGNSSAQFFGEQCSQVFLWCAYIIRSVEGRDPTFLVD